MSEVSNTNAGLGPVIDGTAAAVQRTRDRTVHMRPATVVGVTANHDLAIVLDDHDTASQPFGAYIILPTSLRVGDRVMVLYQPPHGAYVVGILRGGFVGWQFVRPSDGGIGSFTSGWTNTGGTGFPDTATFMVVGYRRVGESVEIRGRATRTSGVSNTVFVLPEPYRPRNNLVFVTVTAPVAVGLVVVNQNGNVDAIGTVDAGSSGYISFDSVAYSVD